MYTPNTSPGPKASGYPLVSFNWFVCMQNQGVSTERARECEGALISLTPYPPTGDYDVRCFHELVYLYVLAS